MPSDQPLQQCRMKRLLFMVRNKAKCFPRIVCPRNKVSVSVIFGSNTVRLKTSLPFRLGITVCGGTISDRARNQPAVTEIGNGSNGQMATSLLKLGMKGSVDALDGNKKMLEKAEKKKICRNHVQVLLTNKTPLQFPSNAYDVVVCCCGMVPALSKPECLPDMVRVVKPGGHLYFNIRANGIDSTFRDRVNGQLAKMIKSGLVEKTTEDMIPQCSWPMDDNQDRKSRTSAVAICLTKLKPSEK